MDEKKLKIILALFPVVIIILALIVPLYSSGWDIEKALYGTDPFAVIESFEMSGMDAGADTFAPQDFKLSDDKQSFILTGIMKNPFSKDITVKKLGYTVLIGGDSADMKLAGDAQIPASGTGMIILSAPVTENQKNALIYGERISYGKDPLTELAFDMHGIIVTSGGI